MNAIVEEGKAAVDALASLGQRHAESFPRVSHAVRTACEHARARIDVEEVAVLLTGPLEARRIFLDRLAGEPLFAGRRAAPDAPVIVVRRGEIADYLAQLFDGTTERFSGIHPDRGPWFAGAIETARRDVDTERAAIAAVERRLVEVREREVPPPPPPPKGLLALWMTVVGFVLGLFGRAPRRMPALPPGPAVIEAKIERRDLESDLARRRQALDSLLADTERLEKEASEHRYTRAYELARRVRTIVSSDDRVAELRLELPSTLVPEGIAIVDAPEEQWSSLRERIRGCVHVHGAPVQGAARDDRPRFGPIAAHDLPLEGAAHDLPSIVESIRAEAPLAALALVAEDLPPHLRSLSRAASDAEAEGQARIASLERARTPGPEAFREAQLEQMAGVIRDGAAQVLAGSKARLHTRMRAVEEEWTTALDACRERDDLVAQLAAIDELAPPRLQALVERLGDDVGAEVQAASETLQAWVLDELRRRYRTRRDEADAGAMVVAEVPGGELAPMASPRLGPAVARADRRTLGLAGGALVLALGAGVGISIVLGLVLAAVAVAALALLRQRTAGLRDLARERIRAYLAEVEAGAMARLELSAEGFARDIRAAVDDTLEDALRRREAAIARLLALEDAAIDRERARVAEVTSLRAALEEQEARFADLATRAAKALDAATITPSRT